METTDPDGQGRQIDTEMSESPSINAYSTCEERTVFTESGNGDGWIATDLTVEPEN